MTLPNIVFIVLDTLRADRVILSKNNECITPFIKSLLNNSIYFKNCISNSPWTIPSHISMFTGLYHTQANLLSKKFRVLSNKIPTLAEILQNMGYYTTCFSENPYISKAYALTRGFNKTFYSDWDFNPKWIRKNFKLSFFLKALQKLDFYFKNKIKFKFFLRIWHILNKISERIIKLIIKTFFFNEIKFELKNDTIKDLEKFGKTFKNGNFEKPFFLFFNLLTTHDPYIPLERTFEKFDISIKDFKNVKNLSLFNSRAVLDINIKSKRLNNDTIRSVAKLYDACVFSGDIIVKYLFSILNKHNLLENSYVIITSDHGEHLGSKLDHFLWEHSTYQSVYKSLNKVPLLIYNKDFKKTIIDNQVQLKDLFHTVLDITKIPPNKNKYLELSKSILYQIKNGLTPKYIFGDYLKEKQSMFRLINYHRRSINKDLIYKIYNHIYFLRSNNYKIISFNNQEIDEFYDILKDPDEKTNIIERNEEEYEKMKSFLRKIIKKINNIEEIKDLINRKEKNLIKSFAKRIKIP